MKRIIILFLLLAAPALANRMVPPSRDEILLREMLQLSQLATQELNRAAVFIAFHQLDLAESQIQSTAMTVETIDDYNRMLDNPRENLPIKVALAGAIKALDSARVSRDAELARFSLPAETVGTTYGADSYDGQHHYGALLYTVPDKSFTRADLIAKADAIANRAADFPCQSYIAIFDLDNDKRVKVDQIALPPNLRPYAVVGNPNDLIFVRAQNSTTGTTLLLKHGKHAHFLDGPAKGPVTGTAQLTGSVSPTRNLIVSSEFDHVWTLTEKDKDLILTAYPTTTLRWETQVTFHNDKIIRIESAPNPKSPASTTPATPPAPHFDIAAKKPINEALAKELADFYARRGDFETPSSEFVPTRLIESATFDEKEKSWIIMFYDPIRRTGVQSPMGIILHPDGGKSGEIIVTSR